MSICICMYTDVHSSAHLHYMFSLARDHWRQKMWLIESHRYLFSKYCRPSYQNVFFCKRSAEYVYMPKCVCI